ncbi:MAG: hypothetical protein HYW86_02775 [Candidatus Roizmanbacteria bacterium]|nr:MAG: hypothetical protein HYW86_02775 [Candidatus Roizmanbacteria bacterium]
MSPITFCQTFQERFKPLPEQLREIDNLVLAYMSNPSQELEKRFNELKALHQDFVGEYQQQVKEMLMHWYPYTDKKQREEFLRSIDFEDNQRVVIKGNINYSSQDQPVPAINPFYRGNKNSFLSYFPGLIRKIIGDLDLYGSHITNLDYLEEIEGDFRINIAPLLQSIGRLKKIGGNALIFAESLTQMDYLEEVQGYLNIDYSKKITSLPRLKRVGSHLTSVVDTLTQFPLLEEVGEEFYAHCDSSPKLKKAGSIDIKTHNTDPLPLLEEVTDSFTIKSSNPAISLPSLRRIGGRMIIDKTKITDFHSAFPNLSAVGSTRNNDNEDESFHVPRNYIKKQIEALRENGRLSFNGKIKVE